MPWDMLAPPSQTNSKQNSTTAVLGETLLRLGALPSLVLIADLSCSAALIRPLVSSLVELRAALPRGSAALLAHEDREPEVDKNFERMMHAAGLVMQPIELAGEASSNSRLRMWRVPLGEEPQPADAPSGIRSSSVVLS